MRTPHDPDVERLIDNVASALQSALLLAAKLATDLRTSAHEAGEVYSAVARASEAVRQFRSGGAE